MARRQVVEIKCDRCSRTELVDPGTATDYPDLQLAFGSSENTPANEHKPEILVNYEDLCSSCTKSVRNYIAQIRMEAKKKDDTETASSSSQESGPETTQPGPV